MDNKQQDEQQSRMSRSQYRQQQRQAEQQSSDEPLTGAADHIYSREAAAGQRHDETVAEKTARLHTHTHTYIHKYIHTHTHALETLEKYIQHTKSSEIVC